MHIILTDISQLKSLKRHDSFETTCEKCGTKYQVTDFRPERLDRYKHILCQPCYSKMLKLERYGDPNYNNRDKSKETCIEKYGVENPHQNKDIISKCENTCLEKYGVTNPNKTKEVRDKIEKTNLKRYGATCSLHGEDIHKKVLNSMNKKYGVNYTAESEFLRNKMYDTRLKKYGDKNYTNREKANETVKNLYGVDNVMQLKSMQEEAKKSRINKYGEYNNMPKLINTVRERYGVDCIFQNGYISDKIKETMIEKYGSETYIGSDHYNLHKSEYIEKMMKTMNERYGVNCFTKCDSYKEMMIELRNLHPEIFQSKRLVYYGLSFDSIPEFAVYLYCTYFGIPIIRNPGISFDYIDIKGISHKTYPDFIINGKLIEIKGAHFFKEDGTMYLPYRNKEWSDEEYKYQSSIYESKRKCLINNGVLIYKDSDPWIIECVSWLESNLNIDLYTKSNPLNICYGYSPFNINSEDEYCPVEGLGLSPFDIDE